METILTVQSRYIHPAIYPMQPGTLVSDWPIAEDRPDNRAFLYTLSMLPVKQA
jgi:hypothetical protein